MKQEYFLNSIKELIKTRLFLTLDEIELYQDIKEQFTINLQLIDKMGCLIQYDNDLCPEKDLQVLHKKISWFILNFQ